MSAVPHRQGHIVVCYFTIFLFFTRRERIIVCILIYRMVIQFYTAPVQCRGTAFIDGKRIIQCDLVTLGVQIQSLRVDFHRVGQFPVVVLFHLFIQVGVSTFDRDFCRSITDARPACRILIDLGGFQLVLPGILRQLQCVENTNGLIAFLDLVRNLIQVFDGKGQRLAVRALGHGKVFRVSQIKASKAIMTLPPIYWLPIRLPVYL